jgi:hypothetical protein
MKGRKTQFQGEHDAVVEASARTYADWSVKGFGVATNPGPSKNRFVGSADSPQYPDVIIWRPNSPGASTGVAKIIEEIETDDSVTGDEADQWADYASLGIETFNLVVPVSKKTAALEIIRRKRIVGITRVQGYQFQHGQVLFD